MNVDRVRKQADTTLLRLKQGMDAFGLVALFRDGMEVAEAFQDMTGPEREEFVLEYVSTVIREAPDLPGPDVVTEFVLLWVVRECGPALIRLVVDATRGALDVNR